jgi:hypothetical protein
VAQLVRLGDFTKEEVNELNKRHNFPLVDQNEVRKLMNLIGGHPYLIRQALYWLAVGKTDLKTLLAQPTKDTGPFAEHLEHYRRRILEKPDLKQALIYIYRHGSWQESQGFHRLKEAGLIKRVEQQALFRNALYAGYFKERL